MLRKIVLVQICPLKRTPPYLPQAKDILNILVSITVPMNKKMRWWQFGDLFFNSQTDTTWQTERYSSMWQMFSKSHRFRCTIIISMYKTIRQIYKIFNFKVVRYNNTFTYLVEIFMFRLKLVILFSSILSIVV